MVKKSYVMPVSNKTRTRLRTTLLAGSTTSAIIDGTGNTDQVSTSGKDPINNGSGGIGDARRRSVSSVD